MTGPTTIDELRALQLERLRETLRAVYERVPHYTRAFGEAGVHPDELESLADLARFPFTAKDDLRANYPFGLFAVPREDVLRIHASSGTTGKPTVVGYTRGDIDTWAELMARSIAAAEAGRATSSTSRTAMGCSRRARRPLRRRAAGLHRRPGVGGMTERQVQLIIDFRPRIIMVTPSYFLAIAGRDRTRRASIRRRSSLEIGIFGAEPWTDEMRARSRSAAGSTPSTSTGSPRSSGRASPRSRRVEGRPARLGGPLPTRRSSTRDAEPLPDGDEGELVFTSLTKEAMPIVRYRTRDLTRLLPGTSHAPHRRMQKVTGRSDDMMIVRGVNVFPSQIEEQILAVDGLTPHYVCVLTRPGRLDALTVRVEALDTFAAGDAAARLGAELVARVKETVGVSIDVDVVAPGTLERSQGKAKRIDDRR